MLIFRNRGTRVFEVRADSKYALFKLIEEQLGRRMATKERKSLAKAIAASDKGSDCLITGILPNEREVSV